MGGSTGIVYGDLKYQARCIADVSADPDNTSFLAGTLSLREENEVHLIRMSTSGTELVCEGLFYHPSEIWDLKSCPFDPRIFSTVFTSGETHGASLWEIPELYGQSNAPQLKELVSLKEHSFKIKCVVWWPTGKHDKLVSIDDGNIFLWSIDSSNKTAKVISQESVGMLHSLSGGVWDPHDRNAIAAMSDSSLQFWDLRTMKKASSIEHIHVRDADYNPKKQFMIVTAEDGSGIRLWDLRMPKLPLTELPGHSHWTWAVRYNPQYVELILSAGTDSAVNLWSASSAGDDMSSESPKESPTRKIDPLLHSYKDYEDSVYGLAWSSREPSIFASLSYDGRVVAESVKPYLPRN
ncbi:putative transcription factor WD40-like family [Dioscorea sansibarensis]